MAGYRPARGGALETMEDFYKRRQADVANLGLQAEAAAHKAYGEATRAGQNLALRTQAEVNRYGADLLSGRKRPTGEDLGRIRSIVNGERPVSGPKERYYPNGGQRYTVVDHTTGSGLRTEQKFGRSIRDLRPMQQAAYDELGDGYRVDHFLPRDIGAVVAYPFGQIGYHEILADDPYR